MQGHLFAFCVHELLVNELLQGGYVQDCDFKEKISSELFSVKVNGKNKMLDSLIGKMKRPSVCIVKSHFL